MKNKNTLRLVAATVLAISIVVGLRVLPVKVLLASFLERVESTGPWGPVLLVAVYVIASVLFVPGSILTLGAGFLFGVVKGTIVVSCGSLLGAIAAFIVGRTLLRQSIERRVASNARFRAIDRAVGEQGFKIVLLTRLAPIFPFNLLNYAFGLTNVRLSQYILASWIGMLPGTVMYVYFGSALKNLAEVAVGTSEGGTLQTVFFLVGLVMAVVATIAIASIARRALSEVVDEQGVSEEDGTRETGSSVQNHTFGAL